MDNYKCICEAINEAAIKCGRNPVDVQLVAVSKTATWLQAASLYHQGQRDFAENRVKEVLEKQELAPNDCRWHFIGTLQKNKVHKIIGHFALIHSVDSLELAQKISHLSTEANLVTQILLQVNTSGESTKHGMKPEECRGMMEVFFELPGLSVQGLMTIAPFLEDKGVIRSCFSALRDLRDEINAKFPEQRPLKHLSMGMSHDFRLAIAEGATMLRIGTALFEGS